MNQLKQKLIINKISYTFTIVNPDVPRQEYFSGYELWKIKILFFHHFLL